MLKLRERYFIKIIPQRGDFVHRFEVTRKSIVVTAAILACVVLGSLAVLFFARAQVAALQSLTHKQLRSIDQRAADIRTQLQQVQRQNQEIRQLIGVPAKKAAPKPRASFVSAPAKPVAQASASVEQLAAASVSMIAESARLRRLTMRVLNVRHLQELQRARLLAAIPSINPVGDAPIVGCFCFRSSPDYEFHPGVDLGASYGDAVHATAAGTISSAGWDGGYGWKIDIDHGNGYHTWYAHLSRMDVQAGSYVHKGQQIGLVGDSGFSTGPHLHYQVMLDGRPIDPSPFLNGIPSNVLASLP